MTLLRSPDHGDSAPQPGRELDALIAERVFWWTGRTVVTKRGRQAAEIAFRIAPGDGLGSFNTYKTADGVTLYCGRPWAPHFAPPCSTDRAAAWIVVDEVMKSASSYEARQNHESLPRFAFVDTDGEGFSREGTTLPHAICLAALALMDHRASLNGGSE